MAKISRRQALKLIGLTTASGVLAACTQAPATPTSAPAAKATVSPTAIPAKGKLVTITIVEAGFGLPQFQDSVDPVMQAISKKMQDEGLNIEIKSMILADHDSKYPLLYSSGADFTMAFDAPWAKMTSLMDQGALAPLEDLINQSAPKLLEEITPKIYQFNFMKGHLYGIPAAFYYGDTWGVIIREDLRKKYNVPAPTSAASWPSLEPFLQAIKDNEPGLIPFGLDYTWALIIPNGKNFWAQNFSMTNTGLGMQDTAIGKPGTTWSNMEDQGSSFMDGVNLTRSWYEKGLLPQQDLSTSSNVLTVLTDYFVPGKTAAFGDNETEYLYFDYNKQLKVAFPNAEAKGYEMLGETVGKYKGPGVYTQWNFIVFNANALKEQLQAGIQFFNWLASSQDNIDLWLMGIDGVNYKKEANLGFSEVPGVDQTRNYRREWYVSGIGGRFQRQPSDLPQDARDALTFLTTESNWEFNPYERFQIDTKAVETELAQIAGVYAEAIHGAYSGQMPVADSVKKLTSTLDGAGRQQLRDKVQKQFDDWRAANPNG